MKRKQAHFIGIGGIGVSALARYFMAYGYKVTGSDLVYSQVIEGLERDGASVFIGHNSTNIQRGTELVIYSPAIKNTNVELQAARKTKIKTLSYPKALSELIKKFRAIAVSGTHGKSTTTSLIALLLTKAGFDPTVIVGTNLREFRNSNFRNGKSEYLVVEADEWNKSFYNYYPKIVVLTNIDKDHLDTYGDLRGVVMGFKKYLSNLENDAVVIANYKDQNVRSVVNQISKKNKFKVIFYNKKRFLKHSLGIPGIHNQENAEAAWQVAKLLGIKRVLAEKVFKNYKGSWRRLEKLEIKSWKLEVGKVDIYSDYAHHPTEIKATLEALREKYPSSQIIAVFEPHQQLRLERLFKDFIQAFDEADTVILMPVYKVEGRDERTERGSFELTNKIRNRKKNVFYADNFEMVIKNIKRELKENGVIVFMCAGDLDGKVREFLL